LSGEEKPVEGLADRVASVLSSDGQNAEIIRAQAEHRLKLIDFWGIPAGSRVLEIGCGQGDTTAALAITVGKDGFVRGIDVAPASYGAPETLGAARDRIMRSEIGNRVRMDFEVSFADGAAAFGWDEYDYIVLSHCLWYFASPDELLDTLRKAHKWGKNLRIAEWNPRAERPDQLPHYKAAVIQAICESFKETSRSNIRTMLYPADIEGMVKESGWSVTRTTDICSPDMRDGVWEVNETVAEYPGVIESLSNMPQRLKRLLLSQIEELKKETFISPMPVFCLNGTA
jgi:ubiquinone/menaquinone biosynthesis C-methylase UbiE